MWRQSIIAHAYRWRIRLKRSPFAHIRGTFFGKSINISSINLHKALNGQAQVERDVFYLYFPREKIVLSTGIHATAKSK